ncbi:MAG: hypothetical protein ACLVJ6_04805 [Merdibacter sp.]
MLTLERYLEQFAPDADRAQYILFIREGENLKPFASAGGPVAERNSCHLKRQRLPPMG